MDITTDLQRLADPIRAEHSAKFFKTGPGQYGEGDEFLGVTMPELRTVCRKHRDLNIAELKSLLTSPLHEYRMAAVVIMSDVFRSSSPSKQDDMYNLYLWGLRAGRINNWDLIDVSAQHIVGEYLLDKPADPLYQLAQSHNLWERRASILSTFAFLRNNNATHTLRLAEMLLCDTHDLMHKAVGWLLRETGKQAGEKTLLVFLDRHAHYMPRTMLRYAIERLSKEQRLHYMSQKSARSHTV